MGLTDLLSINTAVIKKPILKNIDIDDIRTNELNIESMEGLEDLKESIATLGLMKPLEVYQVSNEEYRLLGGERRYHVLKKLIAEDKYDYKVPVLVYTKQEDEALERLMMLLSNSNRPEEYIDYLKRTKEALEMLELRPELKSTGMLTRDFVGSLIGCKGRTAQKYMSILAGKKEVKDKKDDVEESARKELALCIQKKLGTKVKCSRKKLEIYFTDTNDLNRILELISLDNVVNEY